MSTVHSYPGDPEKYRYWRALRALRCGDHDGAAPTFESLARRQDLCGQLSRYYTAVAHQRLGMRALHGNEYAQAAAHFRTALRLNPASATLTEFLAQVSQSGSPALAAGRNGRFSADARLGLALTLSREGRPGAALAVLRQGLASDPDNLAWRFQEGVILGALEEHRAAIAALHQVLRLDPQHTDALVHIALCHGAINEVEQAAQYLAAAHARRPHDARVGLWLALAHQAGPAAHARRPVEVAAEPIEVVDLEDLEALVHLASEEPDVIDAFTAPGPMPAEGPEVLRRLALALRQAVELQPGRATLHYHLGRVLERLGCETPAGAAYKQALEVDPDLVPALIALAKLDFRHGQTEQASNRLQRVLGLGCNYADVHYLLGCLHLNQGSTHQARDAFERALGINARYQAARAALDNLAA